jgi:hypothetical protein
VVGEGAVPGCCTLPALSDSERRDRASETDDPGEARKPVRGRAQGRARRGRCRVALRDLVKVPAEAKTLEAAMRIEAEVEQVHRGRERLLSIITPETPATDRYA